MKISGKRLVLARHPKATIERQVTHGRKVYFLVRKVPFQQDWTGCGDTPAQAWNDAADRLGITELPVVVKDLTRPPEETP